MIISTAQPDDLGALVDLDSAACGAEERWATESWRSELDADGLVLVAKDAASGSLLAAAAFRQVEDDAELFHVVVRPDARRTGLAKRLIGVGDEWAAARGANRMLLEVRDANTPALALYGKLGYEPLAVRRDYYGAGASAVVMSRDLDLHDRQNWLEDAR